MDSEKRRRYSAKADREDPSTHPNHSVAKGTEGKISNQISNRIRVEHLSPSQAAVQDPNQNEFMVQIKTGQLLVVNSRRKNGAILYKKYYAEFAGPGAAVGGAFDLNCDKVIPVGDLSLITPDSYEDRQRAYLTRRQWIRLTQQMTDHAVPIQRVQKILSQFENYFDAETVASLPDEAFALLVGVLPQTVKIVRSNIGVLKE